MDDNTEKSIQASIEIEKIKVAKDLVLGLAYNEAAIKSVGGEVFKAACDYLKKTFE